MCRPREGLFGLREWALEGYVPEIPDDAPPLAPPPPKKIRTGRGPGRPRRSETLAAQDNEYHNNVFDHGAVRHFCLA